jgi:hypothetical protein
MRLNTGLTTAWAVSVVTVMVALGGCTQTPQASKPEDSPSSTTSPSLAPPPKGLDAEAKQAWYRWQEQGIDDYSYQLGVSCFCPRFSARVVVEGGRVVQVGDKPAGTSKELIGFGRLEPTIDNAFVLLGHAQQRADAVTVSFDDTTGAPTNIYVDYSTNGSDDEVSYDLDSLTASTA